MNIRTPSSNADHLLLFVPSQAGGPSLQGYPLAIAYARMSGSAHDSHFPMPPTTSILNLPLDLYLRSVYEQQSGKHERWLLPLRQERSDYRALRRMLVSTSGQRSIPGSSMEPTVAAAIDNARESVQKFVRDHLHAIEPCIGDPAAMAIIGSNPRLGTHGKPLYSAFFFTRSGKLPSSTFYNSRHVDAPFSPGRFVTSGKNTSGTILYHVKVAMVIPPGGSCHTSLIICKRFTTSKGKAGRQLGTPLSM